MVVYTWKRKYVENLHSGYTPMSFTPKRSSLVKELKCEEE